jgi:hypothetical protein
MTPNLGQLLVDADAKKQAHLLAIAANEHAAQLAAQAKASHEGCYAKVQETGRDLAAARAALNAALDGEYGPAADTAQAQAEESASVSAGGTDAPAAQTETPAPTSVSAAPPVAPPVAAVDAALASPPAAEPPPGEVVS